MITKTQIQAEVGRVNFDYKFVPYLQSRNAGKWESLNYIVTFSAGEQTSADHMIIFDYSMGIGHLPKRVAERINRAKIRFGRHSIMSAGMLADVLATGNGGLGYGKREPIWPKDADVLFSLLMDYSVLDYMGFEDWADNMGYDQDSRKAEKDYNHCLKIAVLFRNILGDAKIEKLKEMFQDY